MKIKRNSGFWMGAITGLAVVGISSIASAKESYDLYSWRKPDATYSCYVLVPSSTQPVVAADLQASKYVVCGKNQIKNQIENLPKNAKVEWKIAPDQGLVLPSADAVKSIQHFSAQNDHPMTLPKETPPMK